MKQRDNENILEYASNFPKGIGNTTTSLEESILSTHRNSFLHGICVTYEESFFLVARKTLQPWIRQIQPSSWNVIRLFVRLQLGSSSSSTIIKEGKSKIFLLLLCCYFVWYHTLFSKLCKPCCFLLHIMIFPFYLSKCCWRFHIFNKNFAPR